MANITLMEQGQVLETKVRNLTTVKVTVNKEEKTVYKYRLAGCRYTADIFDDEIEDALEAYGCDESKPEELVGKVVQFELTTNKLGNDTPNIVYGFRLNRAPTAQAEQPVKKEDLGF